MRPVLDELFDTATKRTRARYWLISDLQQRDPALAERYFRTAMKDMHRMSLDLNGICYLGDAAEGVSLTDLKTMTDMQLDLLDSLNVPVYYVMGNHELDFYRKAVQDGTTPRIPFYEAIRNRKNWHTVPDQETFWFTHETDDFVFLFFSDHAAEDGSWIATHQALPPQEQPYPHTKEVWQSIRDRFAAAGKPVFTFAHCGFPGGNRPSQYLEQLLPLPDNFRAHIHGHAHIGDREWAGKDLYRQISGMDDHPQMQFDIASLDSLRGTTVRSAVFDYFGDGEYGISFRDHKNQRWEQVFFSAHSAKEPGPPERFR